VHRGALQRHGGDARRRAHGDRLAAVQVLQDAYRSPRDRRLADAGAAGDENVLAAGDGCERGALDVVHRCDWHLEKGVGTVCRHASEGGSNGWGGIWPWRCMLLRLKPSGGRHLRQCTRHVKPVVSCRNGSCGSGIAKPHAGGSHHLRDSSAVRIRLHPEVIRQVCCIDSQPLVVVVHDYNVVVNLLDIVGIALAIVLIALTTEVDDINCSI
jgi:hypothetical protein